MQQSSPEFMESTAGQVAAEVSRRGIRPGEHVTTPLGTDDLIPGRRGSRLRVTAAGLTDAEIDRMIEEERERETRFSRGLDEDRRLYECLCQRRSSTGMGWKMAAVSELARTLRRRGLANGAAAVGPAMEQALQAILRMIGRSGAGPVSASIHSA